MNFIDIAKRRYACRTYRADKVEKEKLDLILEAAHVAPTGANRQPQKLIVVQEKEGLAKVAKYLQCPFSNHCMRRSYTCMETSI